MFPPQVLKLSGFFYSIDVTRGGYPKDLVRRWTDIIYPPSSLDRLTPA